MKLFHKITLPAGLTPSHFQRPAKIIVSGPSMSGKTTIVQYILANNLISPAPLSTHWVCEGTVPEKLPHINYIEGGIPEPEFFENLRDAAVVLDDCQTSAGDSDIIAKLFRRLSHHNRLIVFLIVQNLNFTGRRALDARRNCDYYILFRNAADHDQYQRFQPKLGLTKGLASLNNMLAHIGRQNPQYSLIIDLKFNIDDLLRFRCDPRYGTRQTFFAVRGVDKALLSGARRALSPTDADRPANVPLPKRARILRTHANNA